jgi:L-ascorbate metabolism protein UlaG (beta-lactamase superfamily)
MSSLNNGLRITWLGHSAFLFETPGGKRLLIDPWIQHNPVCPEPYKSQGVENIDYMLITHGHDDHMADALSIARSERGGNPTAVAVFEVGVWLSSKGVEKVELMHKGGTIELPGSRTIRVTAVHADHSSSITDENGATIYGGEPCGYVVEFENGFKVYHAGDTAVFGDMAIIGELYQPDLCLLPIGSRFTMSPREAAYAIKLLGAKRVIPMHFGTFPLLTGTPEALKELLTGQDVELIVLKPGETLA